MFMKQQTAIREQLSKKMEMIGLKKINLLTLFFTLRAVFDSWSQHFSMIVKRAAIDQKRYAKLSAPKLLSKQIDSKPTASKFCLYGPVGSRFSSELSVSLISMMSKAAISMILLKSKSALAGILTLKRGSRAINCQVFIILQSY